MIILQPESPQLKKVEQGSTGLFVFEGRFYAAGLSFPKRIYEQMQKTLEEEYRQTQIPYFLVDMGDYYTAWHGLDTTDAIVVSLQAQEASVNPQPRLVQPNAPVVIRESQNAAPQGRSAVTTQTAQESQKTEAQKTEAQKTVSPSVSQNRKANDSQLKHPNTPELPATPPPPKPVMRYRGVEIPANPSPSENTSIPELRQYGEGRPPADSLTPGNLPISKPVIKYRGVPVDPPAIQIPPAGEQEPGQQDNQDR
jgi:hypothetical protein